MTVKEFLKNNSKLAIHCTTAKQARKLLNRFDELGYDWWDGPIFKKASWKIYGPETCYTNDAEFANREFYFKRGILVINFSEIDDFKEEHKNDI